MDLASSRSIATSAWRCAPAKQVILRGQTGTDLNEVMHGAGDVVAQAGQATDNVAVLLGEAGASLADVVKATVFVTDRAFLPGVTDAVLRRLNGVDAVLQCTGGEGAGQSGSGRWRSMSPRLPHSEVSSLLRLSASRNGDQIPL